MKRKPGDRCYKTTKKGTRRQGVLTTVSPCGKYGRVRFSKDAGGPTYPCRIADLVFDDPPAAARSRKKSSPTGRIW